MKREGVLKHEFVEYVPNDLKEGVVYVSIVYATAVHKCCCGCGSEVVTPISPVDWQLTFDGESVSLHPSIGNWGFKCRSHYWIRRNRVIWAPQWTQKEIETGRAEDTLAQETYFDKPKEPGAKDSRKKKKTAWWDRKKRSGE